MMEFVMVLTTMGLSMNAKEMRTPATFVPTLATLRSGTAIPLVVWTNVGMTMIPSTASNPSRVCALEIIVMQATDVLVRE